MGDNKQVPTVGQMISHITPDMPVAAVLRSEKIARPSIVTACGKRPAHDAGRLATDQDTHFEPTGKSML